MLLSIAHLMWKLKQMSKKSSYFHILHAFRHGKVSFTTHFFFVWSLSKTSWMIATCTRVFTPKSMKSPSSSCWNQRKRISTKLCKWLKLLWTHWCSMHIKVLEPYQSLKGSSPTTTPPWAQTEHLRVGTVRRPACSPIVAALYRPG